MYYPLYNNPFYYPPRAYINNMCSSSYVPDYSNVHYYSGAELNMPDSAGNCFDRNTVEQTTINENSKDFFSINGDRLEIFGISINIDDLIVLIMLFFMFRENQIDYSIIIILALILFDQN